MRDPALVARTAAPRLHLPSDTRNPTNGMTASLGTGAIILSRAMRTAAPRYPVVSRNRTARVETASVIILPFLDLKLSSKSNQRTGMLKI